MLKTTLRSTPCGRSGLANGSSPAATRSVQSANTDSAFFGPRRPSVVAMFAFACPAWRRRVHDCTESAAHPHVEAGLRNVGNHVTAAVVGDDHLGELGGEVGGLRDDPNASFRTVGTGAHTTEISAADRDLLGI